MSQARGRGDRGEAEHPADVEGEMGGNLRCLLLQPGLGVEDGGLGTGSLPCYDLERDGVPHLGEEGGPEAGRGLGAGAGLLGGPRGLAHSRTEPVWTRS